MDSVTKLTAVTHTAGLGVPVQPGFLTLVGGHEASKVHIRQATETSTLENSPESTDCFFQICTVLLFLNLSLATFLGMWYLRFPSQGLNLHALQWKRGVLTIGLPQKSQEALALF